MTTEQLQELLQLDLNDQANFDRIKEAILDLKQNPDPAEAPVGTANKVLKFMVSNLLAGSPQKTELANNYPGTFVFSYLGTAGSYELYNATPGTFTWKTFVNIGNTALGNDGHYWAATYYDEYSVRFQYYDKTGTPSTFPNNGGIPISVETFN